LLILFGQEAFARQFAEDYEQELRQFEAAQGSEKVAALIKLVDSAVDNYPEKALEYAARLEQLDATPSNLQQMELSELSCWGNIFTQAYERAGEHCRRVLQMALSADHLEFQGRAYNGLASIANAQGRDEEAITLYEQAISVSPEPTRRSAGHSNIGGLYKDKGNYALAFEHYSKALEEIQNQQLTAARRCYYSAPTYLSVGDLNLRLEEYDTAREYFNQALACGELGQDAFDQVAGLGGLTKIALRQNDFDLADQLSARALAIAKGKSAIILADAKITRATVLRALGDFEAAFAMARQAEEVAAEQILNSGILDLRLLLVELNLDTGQNREALNVIKSLEEQAETLGRREVLERVLELKPQVFAVNQMYEQAYLAQQHYIKVAGENLSDRTLQRVALLQAEVGLAEQQAATKNAEALARAAELEAQRANFMRNAAMIAGLLLMVIGYLAVMRSFQAKQFAANERAKQQLERELSVRSKQLKQQSDHALELETQMLHSQKLEAVGQLTGGVAHDFNNLLVVVLGAIELVRASDESSISNQDEKLLQQACDAIATGTDITQQLLAYSRQQPLEAKATEIVGLLHSQTAMLGRALGDRVVLNKDFSTDAVWCEIDRSQLITVILNLAINARDACRGSGAVTLTCELFRAAADHPKLQVGDYCLIEVSDDGVGMSEEVLEKITEPFFTTKDTGQGHGLGLSMVYGFVKQSNGDMEVRSTVNQGTTVSLWLPVCAAPDSPVRADLPEAMLKPHHELQSVLLVEDQPEVLEIARLLIKNLGYEVHSATSGDQARDLLMQGLKPSVVFSDVAMPGELDGVGLARWIADYAPDIPVLLTSGHPQESMSQYSAGFIAKPYRSQDIQIWLDKVA
jgi:signal transduction histidine kinase/tetratricopeptide (TPR) repeat protein